MKTKAAAYCTLKCLWGYFGKQIALRLADMDVGLNNIILRPYLLHQRMLAPPGSRETPARYVVAFR
jgi:hypothetical protein